MDKLLATLTVYTFSKEKIKCDYSIIPVEIKDNDLNSLVSTEKINSDNFKKAKNSLVRYSKEKKGNAYKIELLVEGDIEKDEDAILNKIYKLFNKHYWYKPKYKKFLDKKKKLKQINF